MAFKNFKLETDSDGIVLVTWDTPGRSMNVLDETSVTELEEIVKQTTADADRPAATRPVKPVGGEPKAAAPKRVVKPVGQGSLF